MKKIVTILITILCLFIAAGTLFSDDRTENIDMMVVLDKSNSMVEEIESVKEYVQDYLINTLLIPGDRFILIAFYGKTEILTTQLVKENREKELILETVNRIEANGDWTDIGNALDRLKEELEQYKKNNRRKYLLLLTDGKQDAPKDSRYYSPDGSFNHAFLENTKTIQREGWKIQILGIGIESAAEELAKQLSGTYATADPEKEEPIKEQLEEKTEDILGIINLEGKPSLTPIHAEGKTKLNFTLTSSGYEKPKTVTISEIDLLIAEKNTAQVLKDPKNITLKPESTSKISINITIPKNKIPKEAGKDYPVTVTFKQKGTPKFTPAIADSEVHVNSFFENNTVLVIILGILAIIALAGITFGAVRLIQNISAASKLQIKITIGGRSPKTEQITLKTGSKIYLSEDYGKVKVENTRGMQAFAQLSLDKTGLHLTPATKDSEFAKTKIPDPVLGETIQYRTKSGREIPISFEALSK